MKDEEMAGEYAGNISGLDINTTLMVAENKTDAYRLGIYEGFLAGLKAGRPQWHDLRKDKNDLPEDDNQYLVLFCYNYKGKKEMSYEIRNNLQSDFEIHRCYTEQIIAWCELPTFDKE